MAVVNLPAPPPTYNMAWANQYTRSIELALLNVQTAIQNFQKIIVLPNVTTTQKNLLPNKEGLIVFDTTLGKACVNNGATWETILSSPNGANAIIFLGV